MPSAWNSKPGLVLRSLVIFLFSALFPIRGNAEVVKSVRAHGMGLIVDNDVSAAFQQAKRAALREAVEEAVGTLISARTRVRNFATIEDDILSRTEGFVQRFTIVEQQVVDEYTYEVVLDAVVGLGDLQAELKTLNLLIDAVGNPRIICVGRQRLVRQNGIEAVDWGDIEGVLIRVFQQTGADFNLTASVVLDSVDAINSREAAYSSLDRAAELGRRQNADLVIVGDALIQPSAAIKIPFGDATLAETGLKTAVVELQLKVVWSDSKEVVAEFNRVQKAAAISLEAASTKAIAAGVEALADELIENIVEDWREKVYSGRLIHLEVEADREKLARFEREFPQQVGGIQKMYTRAYKEEGAIYEVRIENAAFQLARELSAKGLAGFDIEIVEVSFNTLRLVLSD